MPSSSSSSQASQPSLIAALIAATFSSAKTVSVEVVGATESG
eukprot:CAMPEP_0171828328 /NCGR_PEP_ID=MMETSP0992-20121227/7114_1 /TAXON_ID=483369 /ORGANISM="non described non described, Strain CCMP2098" /LENGTH=41 /DNA_ID= /DNA_START= /DNA_END= /DNA_ORIENTATION=